MNQPWWRDAVVYQVYVRSFADGNGDGVGDLIGVRGRLRYLADLGVDALWLTPFYASPMADGGYDIADHRAVDPALGTLGDAEALIADAHRHGLRVIVELVPNHTSSAHPWFTEALAAPHGSAARDRYIFRRGRGRDGERPPNDWESIFGGPAWTRVRDGSWYLHLFAPEQPDLNWDNPEVREDFADVMRFWLDRGADGFRIDVAHGMIKAPGLPDVGHGGQVKLLGTRERMPYFDQDEVHEVHRELRKVLDEYGAMGVAEAWAPTPERLADYVRSDELHQAFNFPYLQADWSAAELRTAIETSLTANGAVGAPTTWVLSNHDVRRHVTRYGGGWLGTRRARAAALLTLALPGSAYLYQGEELGLPEVDLPPELRTDPQEGNDAGRDGCRVPLPWAYDAPPFGFGPPGGADPWLPIPPEWRRLTVAAQREDEASMLSLYRRALELRRALPALGWGSPGTGAGGGTLRWLDSPDGTLVFARDPGFVCAVNLTERPVTVDAPGEPILTTDGYADGELNANSAAWFVRDAVSPGS